MKKPAKNQRKPQRRGIAKKSIVKKKLIIKSRSGRNTPIRIV